MKAGIYKIVLVFIVLFMGLNRVNATEVTYTQNSGTISIHGTQYQNMANEYIIYIDIKEQKNVKIDYSLDLGMGGFISVMESDENWDWGNEIMCDGAYNSYFTSNATSTKNHTGRAIILITKNDWDGLSTGIDIKFGPDNSLLSNEGLTVVGSSSLEGNTTITGNMRVYGTSFVNRFGINEMNPAAQFHNRSASNTDAAILATTTASSYGDNKLIVSAISDNVANGPTFKIYQKFWGTSANGYINFHRGGDTFGGFLSFGSNGTERLRIDGNGKVGIGTTNPQNALDVKGTIRATEVKVESVDKFADFVFGVDYQLPTLEAVEQHIKEKGHLAEIPSAQEVKENGMSLVDMQVKLLQKVEEMTLYIIQQQKEIEVLKTKVKSLEK